MANGVIAGVFGSFFGKKNRKFRKSLSDLFETDVGFYGGIKK